MTIALRWAEQPGHRNTMGSLDTLIIGAAATGPTAKARKNLCCKPPPIMVYQDW